MLSSESSFGREQIWFAICSTVKLSESINGRHAHFLSAVLFTSYLIYEEEIGVKDQSYISLWDCLNLKHSIDKFGNWLPRTVFHQLYQTLPSNEPTALLLGSLSYHPSLIFVFVPFDEETFLSSPPALVWRYKRNGRCMKIHLSPRAHGELRRSKNLCAARK